MNSLQLQNATRVLTHMGYAIRKDSMTAQELQAVRKELTVAPKAGVGRFAEMGEPFNVFMESPTRLYTPRMWALEKFGAAEANILTEGDPLRDDLVFVGKPYDYQVAIVNTFIEKGANGLICVPCGRGKTFMAINCASRIKKKFMIVVDKEFLLQQWSGELNALMPGIRIGILQGDSKQVKTITKVAKEPTIPELKAMAKEAGLKVGGSKTDLMERLKAAGVKVKEEDETVEIDCCIAMIQTLVQRDFAETEFRGFGFAIFDECHHLGAANFSRALLKVQPKNMLGLSATPTRDDGLTKVFEWFLGKPVYWEKTREADPDVIVKKVEFDTEDPKYSDVPTDPRTGEPILARLLTQVVECEARNELIDQLMADLVKEPKRRILVLSERKSHLERIENGLPKGTTVGYYIGGMKEEVREEGARTAQVLLGTYAMASEAMNIKTLNTMIMASPRKKIEQSTGRILRTRKDEREVEPIIVDIVDSHDVYQSQWLKRRAYYKVCAYKIEGEPEKKKRGKEKADAPVFTGACLIQDD
jgi:superfamily II DNA or RNA helicase